MDETREPTDIEELQRMCKQIKEFCRYRREIRLTAREHELLKSIEDLAYHLEPCGFCMGKKCEHCKMTGKQKRVIYY